jgi:hypothetical protein
MRVGGAGDHTVRRECRPVARALLLAVAGILSLASCGGGGGDAATSVTCVNKYTRSTAPCDETDAVPVQTTGNAHPEPPATAVASITKKLQAAQDRSIAEIEADLRRATDDLAEHGAPPGSHAFFKAETPLLKAAMTNVTRLGEQKAITGTAAADEIARLGEWPVRPADTGHPAADAASEQGSQGAAFGYATRDCRLAGSLQALSSKYGGSDDIKVAENYAKGNYPKGFRLSATRGCLQAFYG